MGGGRVPCVVPTATLKAGQLWACGTGYLGACYRFHTCVSSLRCRATTYVGREIDVVKPADTPDSDERHFREAIPLEGTVNHNQEGTGRFQLHL